MNSIPSELKLQILYETALLPQSSRSLVNLASVSYSFREIYKANERQILKAGILHHSGPITSPLARRIFVNIIQLPPPHASFMSKTIEIIKAREKPIPPLSDVDNLSLRVLRTGFFIRDRLHWYLVLATNILHQENSKRPKSMDEGVIMLDLLIKVVNDGNVWAMMREAPLAEEAGLHPQPPHLRTLIAYEERTYWYCEYERNVLDELIGPEAYEDERAMVTMMFEDTMEAVEWLDYERMWPHRAKAREAIAQCLHRAHWHSH